MGSAYPTIAADAAARYQVKLTVRLAVLLHSVLSAVLHTMQRLRGKTVRFVTGTDEHGEKIAEAAKARDFQPKQHCDSVAEEYKALWSQVCCVVLM